MQRFTSIFKLRFDVIKDIKNMLLRVNIKNCAYKRPKSFKGLVSYGISRAKVHGPHGTCLKNPFSWIIGNRPSVAAAVLETNCWRSLIN